VRRGLGEVVAVPGIDLLSQRVQACMLVGIGHLAGEEILTAETAFGVRLEVVKPRRVLMAAEIRGDEDRRSSPAAR
jgi:hypothetical protein